MRLVLANIITPTRNAGTHQNPSRVHGVSIFYRDKGYLLSGGIKALKSVVIADVEQFLTPHRKATDS
jgi:hypothetical protein